VINDETFFAWLDGELDAADSRAVANEVALDADLQRKAEAHRAMRGRLRDAFDPIAQAPLPDRLVPRQAEVVDLASHRPAARPMPRPLQWAGMAATLAIGVMGGSLIQSGAAGPIASNSGQLVAAGELEQALYTRLASAPADSGARIGLTFRDAAGDLCRSFTDQGAAGLACFQSGDWRIRGLFQSGEGQQSEFRMAGGPDPRLAELIDSTIAGEPLDAAGERKALDGLR
jgi:hypothetical protein